MSSLMQNIGFLVLAYPRVTSTCLKLVANGEGEGASGDGICCTLWNSRQSVRGRDFVEFQFVLRKHYSCFGALGLFTREKLDDQGYPD